MKSARELGGEMDNINKLASDVWLKIKGNRQFIDQEFAYGKMVIADAILTYHKQRTQPLVDALEEYSKKENWDNGGFDFDGEDVYCIFTKPLGKAGWTYAQQVLSKYKEVEK